MIVCLGFLYDLSQVSVDTGALLAGFVPGFDGTDSIMLAVGIIGATVMPHVVYLHSALTQGRVLPRDDRERRSLLRFQRIDVVIAMGRRRRGEPDDARRGRVAVPRDRQHGCRHDRGRPRRASSR